MAHELVDLKLTDTEKKEMMGDSALTSSEPEGPQYPWGLSLDLNTETLEKLDNPEVQAGDEVEVVAIAKVVGVRVNADEKKTTRSVELQLTQMTIYPKAEGETSRAEKLYGSEEG